jgi:hypothetical protein
VADFRARESPAQRGVRTLEQGAIPLLRNKLSIARAQMAETVAGVRAAAQKTSTSSTLLFVLISMSENHAPLARALLHWGRRFGRLYHPSG